MIKEFREFAFKGNMIDLAVGVIIGAAFGKIIASMVEDLIMPLVGLFAGKLDFANHYVALSDKIAPGLPLAEAKKLGAVFAWGNFLTVLLNFLIVALAIFVVVKAVNTARRRFEAEKVASEAKVPVEPPEDVKLLTEIRDILGKR